MLCFVNAVEVHEQQTDTIILIDLHNREYENLPNYEKYDKNEDEVDESDRQCIDENSNDESE